MSKMINHIKRWNSWRKYNCNSWWHKILVLLGVIHSPTFVCYDHIMDKYNELRKRHGYENVELKFCNNWAEDEDMIPVDTANTTKEDTNEQSSENS